ncbi:hypothetical protein [Adlercreutzia agrestimuris]|uniref:hypothetical protein n=1 Tax=Adlercreutzia agrestimuris TaxID=2941324 RepID=UPI002041865F|nr:hypothetical protein [Adlercreutzia agrestimuris]
MAKKPTSWEAAQRKAWRASKSPLLYMLTAFSFVLVVAGVGMYIAVVPSLAQEAPLLQGVRSKAVDAANTDEASADANHDQDQASDTHDEKTDAKDAVEDVTDAETESTQDQDQDEDETSATDVETPAAQIAPNPSAASTASNQSSPAGNTDVSSESDSATSDASAQSSTVPTDDSGADTGGISEGQAIAYFNESCSALGAYLGELSNLQGQFISLCDTITAGQRQSQADSCQTLANNIAMSNPQGTFSGMPALDYAGYGSRKASLIQAYADAQAAANQLAQTWRASAAYDDPAAHKSEWIGGVSLSGNGTLALYDSAYANYQKATS